VGKITIRQCIKSIISVQLRNANTSARKNALCEKIHRHFLCIEKRGGSTRAKSGGNGFWLISEKYSTCRRGGVCERRTKHSSSPCSARVYAYFRARKKYNNNFIIIPLGLLLDPLLHPPYSMLLLLLLLLYLKLHIARRVYYV
jgi:hypothetical protein